MDESAILIDSGLLDLTNVPLDALDAIEDEVLAPSVERFLTQLDQAGSSVGGGSDVS